MSALQIKQPEAKPDLALDKFVGTFHHPILETIKVIRQDDKLGLEVGKNKTSASLTFVKPSFGQQTNLHCFDIKWLSNMTAAGELYYNEDKIGFVENGNHMIEKIILFAECVTSVPVSCKRIERNRSPSPSIFNQPDEQRAKESSSASLNRFGL